MARPLTALDEDERLFRQSILQFARERIAPHVREMDERGELREGLLAELFELGLMGLEIPEDWGGQGGTHFESILAVEAIAEVDPAVAVVVDVQNTLVNNALVRFGGEAQRERYLPRLARDTVASFALSEAGAGSDAFALATRAVDADGGYRISGRKLWISNAREAGLFLVFATVDPAAGHRGVTAFLIERGAPGLAVGRKEDKLGIRASSTCEVILDDCFVPASNVLGARGQGYRVAIETLNEGRIGIAAQMVGLAEGAYRHALDYVRERRQFGRVLAEFQAIQFELARMATEIHAARLLTYEAARRKMAGQPFATQAAMAKLQASETAASIAARAVDLFGGVGFTKDYPVEKLYRDAKIGTIYEGSSNMQLQTIAKRILAGENV